MLEFNLDSSKETPARINGASRRQRETESQLTWPGKNNKAKMINKKKGTKENTEGTPPLPPPGSK